MNKISLQAKQSKQWIVAALLLLMEDNDFEDITILEIAQTASLDRRTFYRHFKNKKAVLCYHLDNMITLHAADYVGAFSESYQHLEQHLQFVYRHFAFLRMMKKQQLTDLVFKKYDEYVIAIEKMQGIKQHTMTRVFKTGGFWQVILMWIDTEPIISPQELATLLESFITSGLQY